MNIFEKDEGFEEADKAIILLGWKSFGIMVDEENSYIKELDLIIDLIEELNVEKWFFLYEGDRFAVRVKLKRQKSNKALEKQLIKKVDKFGLTLQENSVCSYKEKIGKMFNEETIYAFAEIMVQITNLWVLKRKFGTNFSNYRFMERVSHCMYNVFCGGFIHSLKNEIYFLHQRTLERSKCIFDEEFEDSSSIPKVKLKKYLG